MKPTGIKSKASNGSSSNSKKSRKSPAMRCHWTDAATKFLFKTRTSLIPEFAESRNRLHWKLVSDMLRKRGYHYAASQCSSKWLNLDVSFRSHLKELSAGNPGSKPTSWKFSKEMGAFISATQAFNARSENKPIIKIDIEEDFKPIIHLDHKQDISSQKQEKTEQQYEFVSVDSCYGESQGNGLLATGMDCINQMDTSDPINPLEEIDEKFEIGHNYENEVLNLVVEEKIDLAYLQQYQLTEAIPFTTSNHILPPSTCTITIDDECNDQSTNPQCTKKNNSPTKTPGKVCSRKTIERQLPSSSGLAQRKCRSDVLRNVDEQDQPITHEKYRKLIRKHEVKLKQNAGQQMSHAAKKAPDLEVEGCIIDGREDIGYSINEHAMDAIVQNETANGKQKIGSGKNQRRNGQTHVEKREFNLRSSLPPPPPSKEPAGLDGNSLGEGEPSSESIQKKDTSVQTDRETILILEEENAELRASLAFVTQRWRKDVLKLKSK